MQAFIGIKLQRRPSTLRFASFSITRVVAAKLPGHACDMMGFAEIRLVFFFRASFGWKWGCRACWWDRQVGGRV